jgi:starvation-inducible DNA-binding protein
MAGYESYLLLGLETQYSFLLSRVTERAVAEAIFESIDIMAERVRRVGGMTIRSISYIGQLQTIEDDNSSLVAPGEMVRILMEDNGHIAKMIRDAITVCDKNRDSPTSNLLQDILDKTERRKWFLYEVMQGVENTE